MLWVTDIMADSASLKYCSTNHPEVLACYHAADENWHLQLQLWHDTVHMLQKQPRIIQLEVCKFATMSVLVCNPSSRWFTCFPTCYSAFISVWSKLRSELNTVINILGLINILIKPRGVKSGNGGTLLPNNLKHAEYLLYRTSCNLAWRR